jgi:hypothetical protein
VSVVNTTKWMNLEINIVDAVIDVPGNLSNAFVANNLTKLMAVLQSLPMNGTTGSMFDYLDHTAHGFTLFAPDDAALTAAMGNSSLAGVLGNQTMLATLLGNHVCRPAFRTAVSSNS